MNYRFKILYGYSAIFYQFIYHWTFINLICYEVSQEAHGNDYLNTTGFSTFAKIIAHKRHDFNERTLLIFFS